MWIAPRWDWRPPCLKSRYNTGMPTGVVLQNTPHKARVSSRCAPRRYSLTWTPWVQLHVTQSQPNLAAKLNFCTCRWYRIRERAFSHTRAEHIYEYVFYRWRKWWCARCAKRCRFYRWSRINQIWSPKHRHRDWQTHTYVYILMGFNSKMYIYIYIYVVCNILQFYDYTFCKTTKDYTTFRN